MIHQNSKLEHFIYNNTLTILRKLARKRICEKVTNREQKPEQSISFLIDEVERFIRDCAIKVGCSDDNAIIFGEMLAKTDCLGVKQHGLKKLGMYLNAVKNGDINGQATPRIIKQTDSIAVVNGNNGLGQVLAQYGMGVAIQKAKLHGSAMAVCYNGSDLGISSLYTLLAVECGCIGIAFANSPPLCVPYGAKKRALGSNPFSISGPGLDGDFLNMHITTTAVDVENVEKKKESRQLLPLGLAIDPDGSPATDPVAVLNDTRLLPLGSPKYGYLGYGLSLMTDIMSSVLGGAPSSPFLTETRDHTQKSNVGYTFIAIDPNKFERDFKKRLSAYLDEIRKFAFFNRNNPITVSGDKERSMYINTIKKGVLSYNMNVLQMCAKIAKELHVNPLKSNKSNNSCKK